MKDRSGKVLSRVHSLLVVSWEQLANQTSVELWSQRQTGHEWLADQTSVELWSNRQTGHGNDAYIVWLANQTSVGLKSNKQTTRLDPLPRLGMVMQKL